MGADSSSKVVPAEEGKGGNIRKTVPSWEGRIHRASQLADRYEFAGEALSFYIALTGYQRDAYQYLESRLDGRDDVSYMSKEVPFHILCPRLPLLLSLVKREGPPKLAGLAGELGRMGEENVAEMLQTYWKEKTLNTGVDRAMSFFPRAFLQPYAEYLANKAERLEGFSAGLAESALLCPLCGGRPQAGCLRPVDNGMKRSLICSLCQTGWDFRRLSCPACGEVSNDRFHYYTAGDYPHVRLDACDSCKRYIKTIDMSKDPEAVPVVDELATIPLDLWAADQGYEKIECNILGI